MSQLFALSILVSLDNVRLSACLGLVEPSRQRWWRLALLMAAVEAGFPLIGQALALTQTRALVPVAFIGPGALLLTAALALSAVLWKWRPPAGWMVYLLPLLFGIDNLVVGGAVGVRASSALWLGLFSGAVSLVTMALVGRSAGMLARRWAAAPAAVAVAVSLSCLVLP
jgi:putative Mn2+ efflux pump MntP